MDTQAETIIDNAWFNFEASNKYAALCKKLAAYQIDVDDIILAFLETIQDDNLKKELIHDYKHEIINGSSGSHNYHDAIYKLTEDLIDKELL